jgi:chaperone BCS1
MVNLAEFTDRSLMGAVNRVPCNSVLLFEDIDCMRSSQTRGSVESPGADGQLTTSIKENASTQNGVTLSGLLNVLDGFHAPSGVLFVMTTNHVEKLDEALLRPGRIDYKLYMGQASDHQKIELYRRFFPDSLESAAYEFVEASRASETMAEFQGRLLALEQGDGNLPLVIVKDEIPA